MARSSGSSFSTVKPRLISTKIKGWANSSWETAPILPTFPGSLAVV